jgi:hypothetical protein
VQILILFTFGTFSRWCAGGEALCCDDETLEEDQEEWLEGTE